MAVMLGRSRAVNVSETVLVHNPVSLDASGSFSGVENQSLLNPQRLRLSDRLIGSGSLPVSRSRRAVRPRSVRILPIPRREEIPLLLSVQSLLCKIHDSTTRSDTKTNTQIIIDSIHRSIRFDSIRLDWIAYVEAPRDQTCRDRSP